MARALLMSPEKEEMKKFTRMKLHSLPRDTEVWTDQQMLRIEAGQVLLPVAGVYWDSPSTAVPAFGWKKSWKNCQLLSVVVCTAEIVQRQSTHTCTELASK